MEPFQSFSLTSSRIASRLKNIHGCISRYHSFCSDSEPYQKPTSQGYKLWNRFVLQGRNPTEVLKMLKYVQSENDRLGRRPGSTAEEPLFKQKKIPVSLEVSMPIKQVLPACLSSFSFKEMCIFIILVLISGRKGTSTSEGPSATRWCCVCW